MEVPRTLLLRPIAQTKRKTNPNYSTCSLSSTPDPNPNPSMKKKMKPIITCYSQQPKQSTDPWSSLHPDILHLIAARSINSPQDYASFRSVCTSWCSFADSFDFKSKLLPPHLHTPFYAFGIEPLSRPHPNLTLRHYASKTNFLLHLPEVSGRRFWGSAFAWSVTFNPTDLRFSLLNLFSGASIPLPSLSTLTHHYDPLRTDLDAFLTADPEESPRHSLVLITLTSSASFVSALAKPGRDSAWSRIPAPHDLVFSDFCYFKAHLYALSVIEGARNHNHNRDHSVVLHSIQIQPSPRIVNRRVFRCGRGGFSLGKRKHLVDLNGDLCVVLHYSCSSWDDGSAYGFRVFNTNSLVMERVETLGDHCLFLGNNYAFTCKATNPPPQVGTRDFGGLNVRFFGNCVYYVYHDDYCVSPLPSSSSSAHCPNRFMWIQPDVGVWDMSSSTSLYKGSNALALHQPLWVKPSVRDLVAWVLRG